MGARLGFGENYLEVTGFRFYEKEAQSGNPYNTTFSLVVQSNGFRGVAPCESDIKDLFSFVSDLCRLYNFETDRVVFSDICYGSKVLFAMDRTGHIEISGKIYGDGMTHSLEFCFNTDQTVLKSFLDCFNILLYKIKVNG